MGRRASLALGVLTLVLAGIVAFVALTPSERQREFPVSEQGVAPEVSVPPPSIPSSVPSKSPLPEASPAPTVWRVPASPMVGVEIPALKRSFRVEGVSLGSPITPPFEPDAVADTLYYENDHAVRGADPGTDSSNTVYLTGHTWRGGTAAMNVIDQEMAVGDELLVTTVKSRRLGVRLRYVVTGSERYPEALLPSVDKVWEVAPGRMVIMTCNLRADGEHQTHTHVFYAELRGVTSH